MKHEQIERTPDITDLERALWLSPLVPATRNATLASIRTLAAALCPPGMVSVAALAELLAEPSVDHRSKLGKRATQILSDARRALRVWDDAPLRYLALSMRGRVPNCRDAQTAAGLCLPPDAAGRAVAALDELARAKGALPEDIPATEAWVAQAIKDLSPEDFGGASQKTLDNKRSLCLRAVRLVDPHAREVRTAQIKALPADWQSAIASVVAELEPHETSAAAILKRFAVYADGLGLMPANVAPEAAQSFFDSERAKYATSHEEKMRRFVRAWNAKASIDGRSDLPVASKRTRKLPEIHWEHVPDGIRTPVDALLARAVSVRGDAHWSDLVVDDGSADEFAEFGLAEGFAQDTVADESNFPLEPGTQRNWRDAIKRAWHAAEQSAAVDPKPTCITDLFQVDVARALTLAARKARQARYEAQGLTYDPKSKGRYEHGLIITLIAVGRRLEIDDETLAQLETFAATIDPNIVGTKRQPDGSYKHVYAERRIGERHAKRLAAFSETSRLKRYFEAPHVLWEKASAGLTAGRKPAQKHIALARNALILRIGQYVGPLRRAPLIGLRYTGDDAHLTLPIGKGPGMLKIPAIEMKTLKAVQVQIDPETVQMLKTYIEKFLPQARKLAKAKSTNPHLFPGFPGKGAENEASEGMGHISLAKANNVFREQLKRHCQLDMNLHVMRHLAGKIILDQDPSAMELVRVLLGHESIETTQSYYAEVCSIIAQQQYLHLLAQSQRKTLAQTGNNWTVISQ